jgi:hypothetical protein
MPKLPKSPKLKTKAWRVTNSREDGLRAEPLATGAVK